MCTSLQYTNSILLCSPLCYTINMRANRYEDERKRRRRRRIFFRTFSSFSFSSMTPKNTPTSVMADWFLYTVSSRSRFTLSVNRSVTRTSRSRSSCNCRDCPFFWQKPLWPFSHQGTSSIFENRHHDHLSINATRSSILI